MLRFWILILIYLQLVTGFRRFYPREEGYVFYRHLQKGRPSNNFHRRDPYKLNRHNIPAVCRLVPRASSDSTSSCNLYNQVLLVQPDVSWNPVLSTRFEKIVYNGIARYGLRFVCRVLSSEACRSTTPKPESPVVINFKISANSVQIDSKGDKKYIISVKNKENDEKIKEPTTTSDIIYGNRIEDTTEYIWNKRQYPNTYHQTFTNDDQFDETTEINMENGDNTYQTTINDIEETTTINTENNEHRNSRDATGANEVDPRFEATTKKFSFSTTVTLQQRIERLTNATTVMPKFHETTSVKTKKKSK